MLRCLSERGVLPGEAVGGQGGTQLWSPGLGPSLALGGWAGTPVWISFLFARRACKESPASPHLGGVGGWLPICGWGQAEMTGSSSAGSPLRPPGTPGHLDAGREGVPPLWPAFSPAQPGRSIRGPVAMSLEGPCKQLEFLNLEHRQLSSRSQLP